MRLPVREGVFVLKTRRNAYNTGMGLFAEIKNSLGAEEVSVARVQYSVIDGKGGYFTNVKKLLEFSDTKIVFQGKQGLLCVEGTGLRLGKYCMGDAVVLGNISRVGRSES